MSKFTFEFPPGTPVVKLQPLLKAAMELAATEGWKLSLDGTGATFTAPVPAERKVVPLFRPLPVHHFEGPTAA